MLRSNGLHQAPQHASSQVTQVAAAAQSASSCVGPAPQVRRRRWRLCTAACAAAATATQPGSSAPDLPYPHRSTVAGPPCSQSSVSVSISADYDLETQSADTAQLVASNGRTGAILWSGHGTLASHSALALEPSAKHAHNHFILEPPYPPIPDVPEPAPWPETEPAPMNGTARARRTHRRASLQHRAPGPRQASQASAQGPPQGAGVGGTGQWQGSSEPQVVSTQVANPEALRAARLAGGPTEPVLRLQPARRGKRPKPYPGRLPQRPPRLTVSQTSHIDVLQQLQAALSATAPLVNCAQDSFLDTHTGNPSLMQPAQRQQPTQPQPAATCIYVQPWPGAAGSKGKQAQLRLECSPDGGRTWRPVPLLPCRGSDGTALWVGTCPHTKPSRGAQSGIARSVDTLVSCEDVLVRLSLQRSGQAGAWATLATAKVQPGRRYLLHRNTTSQQRLASQPTPQVPPDSPGQPQAAAAANCSAQPPQPPPQRQQQRQRGVHTQSHTHGYTRSHSEQSESHGVVGSSSHGWVAQPLLQRPCVLVSDLALVAGRRNNAVDDTLCRDMSDVWRGSQRVGESLLVYTTSRSWVSFEHAWRDKQHVLHEPDVLVLASGTRVMYRLADGRWLEDSSWRERLDSDRSWDRQLAVLAVQQVSSALNSAAAAAAAAAASSSACSGPGRPAAATAAASHAPDTHVCTCMENRTGASSWAASSQCENAVAHAAISDTQHSTLQTAGPAGTHRVSALPRTCVRCGAPSEHMHGNGHHAPSVVVKPDTRSEQNSHRLRVLVRQQAVTDFVAALSSLHIDHDAHTPDQHARHTLRVRGRWAEIAGVGADGAGSPARAAPGAAATAAPWRVVPHAAEGSGLPRGWCAVDIVPACASEGAALTHVLARFRIRPDAQRLPVVAACAAGSAAEAALLGVCTHSVSFRRRNKHTATPQQGQDNHSRATADASVGHVQQATTHQWGAAGVLDGLSQLGLF